MSVRVKWINHRGKKILYGDFSGMIGDDYAECIEQIEKEIIESGEQEVYVITDLTGSYMNPKTTSAVKNWIKHCKDHGIKIKGALVGISGLKEIMNKIFKFDLYLTNSVDDAKEFIAAH